MRKKDRCGKIHRFRLIGLRGS